MRYCERQPLAYSIVVCGTFLLLAAVPAAAQGIGPPAGLLEVFLVFWGLCGIVAGVLLGVAFLLEKRRPRSFIAIALVLIALCYSVTAIPCFFLESEGGASKFTGAVGLVVLSFVARYFFRERRSWALGSYALIGLALVALLLIPNAYWEMPLVSFTRIVYEDNLAGAGDSARVLRSPYGYGGRLALDDGRLLIQTQYIPERPRYRGQSETPTYLNGVAVVLEPVTSTERETGTRFSTTTQRTSPALTTTGSVPAMCSVSPRNASTRIAGAAEHSAFSSTSPLPSLPKTSSSA